jgi:hypothetical protein
MSEHTSDQGISINRPRGSIRNSAATYRRWRGHVTGARNTTGRPQCPSKA